MKLRLLIIMITTLFAAEIFSMGCGSSSGAEDTTTTIQHQQELGQETASVTLAGGATAESKAHTKNRAKGMAYKTVSSGSEATGDGMLNGDTVATTCAFSWPGDSYGTQTTGGTGISVVPHGSSSHCTSPTKCIVCTTTAIGADCNINCTGTVPANSDTAADSFEIDVSYTAVIKSTASTVTDPYGMVRLDALATNWDEFTMDATDGFGHPTDINFDGHACSGEMGQNELSLAGESPVFVDFFPHQVAIGINVVGVDPVSDSQSPDYGKSLCSITVSFRAMMPLTGADSGNHSVNLDRGAMNVVAELCDVADPYANGTTCPLPQGFPTDGLSTP